MSSEETWGDRLRARIEASGLTQTQIAASLDVSKARIGELCGRDSPPRISTVLRLALAIGCDPHALDDRLASRPPATKEKGT
jgi:transcriptional regulator with XRE-family HTH domain